MPENLLKSGFNCLKCGNPIDYKGDCQYCGNTSIVFGEKESEKTFHIVVKHAESEGKNIYVHFNVSIDKPILNYIFSDSVAPEAVADTTVRILPTKVEGYESPLYFTLVACEQ